MSRKMKFMPVITRIKLDPEQAVLSCGCPNGIGINQSSGNSGSVYGICAPYVSKYQWNWYCGSPGWYHLGGSGSS